MLAERQGDSVVAKDLSWDQTPMRSDECARVKQAGARVLTLEQLHGKRDANVQDWTSKVQTVVALWHTPCSAHPPYL